MDKNHTQIPSSIGLSQSHVHILTGSFPSLYKTKLRIVPENFFNLNYINMVFYGEFVNYISQPFHTFNIHTISISTSRNLLISSSSPVRAGGCAVPPPAAAA